MQWLNNGDKKFCRYALRRNEISGINFLPRFIWESSVPDIARKISVASENLAFPSIIGNIAQFLTSRG